MTDHSAAFARSITWASSKQSYFIARLLVDKDLVDDCYRAYGYFRWADDVVDTGSQHDNERVSFIKRQRELIGRLYQNERPDNLTAEEEIIADLISYDREGSGLHSFVLNFLAAIEFDAHRKGQLASQRELMRYSNHLGQAVTDAIQYFICNGHPYPKAKDQYLAATAAHITHMLRDLVGDVEEGYINIPREYLEEHGIGPQDVGSLAFRAWVQERVALARQYFRDGKRYIDGLDVLRCKIAAHWYCARFEGVLDTIEREAYLLRPQYNERRKVLSWLRMAWLAAVITARHLAGRRPAAGTLQKEDR